MRKQTFSKVAKPTAISSVPLMALFFSGSKIRKCKSTAKSVATVTGAGRILLLKEGRVKIKVTLKNGRTIPLTLVVQDPNAATELGYRVDRSGPLAVGDVIHITAEVKPAAAAATVTFRSSDASVASVDASGTVTALSPGDATITVSAGGMKLTYDVKVTG